MGGGGGRGASASGPRYEKWGGVAIRFRSDTKSGECDPLQVRDTKSGGGQSASGPMPLFGTQKIRYR